MLNRLKHALLLTPALLVLFIWIAATPALTAQSSLWRVFGMAAASAFVTAWSITLYVHHLMRDK